jgi:hypothetical protein
MVLPPIAYGRKAGPQWADVTEAKRALDLFARTLNIFEDDPRKIWADE